MRSSRSFLACAVLAVLVCLPASGTTVNAIPRPAPGSWSVDMTGTLRPETLAEVNRFGSQLDASGQGQLAVVVVGSTEGVPPRAFATGLFNHWGIGHASRDDGALLFVALDDRRAEIILGDGVDSSGDVERSDALMAHLIPLFADGEPDAAVLEGARGLSALLTSSLPSTGVRAETRSTRRHGAIWPLVISALLFVPALFVRWLFWREEKTGRPWDARPPRHRNVFIPPTTYSSGGGFSGGGTSGGGSFGGGSSSGSGSSGSW